MHDERKKDDVVICNLHDAGCSQAFIEHFMICYRSNNLFEQLSLLEKQRTILLDGIHRNQDKLDCLDYLLFQIKKDMSRA